MGLQGAKKIWKSHRIFTFDREPKRRRRSGEQQRHNGQQWQAVGTSFRQRRSKEKKRRRKTGNVVSIVAHGTRHLSNDSKIAALDFMENMPAENNAIIVDLMNPCCQQHNEHGGHTVSAFRKYVGIFPLCLQGWNGIALAPNRRTPVYDVSKYESGKWNNEIIIAVALRMLSPVRSPHFASK